MAIFELTHYGKPISKELSELVLKRITDDDIADASVKTDVSLSTIDKVIRRKGSLTKRNAPGIIELCSIAFRNAKQAQMDAEYDSRQLKEVV